MSAEIKIGSNVKIPALAALITVTMGLYIHAAWADTCVATNPNDARDELRNKPQGPGLLNTTAILPAGTTVDFILKEPYAQQNLYYGPRVADLHEGG
jgi:hypothetical protein